MSASSSAAAVSAGAPSVGHIAAAAQAGAGTSSSSSSAATAEGSRDVKVIVPRAETQHAADAATASKVTVAASVAAAAATHQAVKSPSSISKQIPPELFTLYRGFTIEQLLQNIPQLSEETIKQSKVLIAVVVRTQNLSLNDQFLKTDQDAMREATQRMRASSRIYASQPLHELTAAKIVLQEKIIEELKTKVSEYLQAFRKAATPQEKIAVDQQFFPEFVQIVEQAAPWMQIKEEVEKKLLQLLGDRRIDYLRYVRKMADIWEAFVNPPTTTSSSSSHSKEKSEKDEIHLDIAAEKVLTGFIDTNERVEFVLYAMEQEVLQIRKRELPIQSKLNFLTLSNTDLKGVLLYRVLLEKLLAILDLTKKFDKEVNRLLSDIQQRANVQQLTESVDPKREVLQENEQALLFIKCLIRLFMRLRGTVMEKLHKILETIFRSLLSENDLPLYKNQPNFLVMIFAIKNILIYRLSKKSRAFEGVAKTSLDSISYALQQVVSYLEKGKQLSKPKDLDPCSFIAELTSNNFHKIDRFVYALLDLELVIFGKSYALEVFKNNSDIARVDFKEWIERVPLEDIDAINAMIAACDDDQRNAFRAFVCRCNIIAQIIRDYKEKATTDDMPGYFNRLKMILQNRGENPEEVTHAFIVGIEAIRLAFGPQKTYLILEQCVVACFKAHAKGSIDNLLSALTSSIPLPVREMIVILDKNQVAIVTDLTKREAHDKVANQYKNEQIIAAALKIQVSDLLTQLIIKQVLLEISTNAVVRDDWWSKYYSQVAQKDEVVRAPKQQSLPTALGKGKEAAATVKRADPKTSAPPPTPTSSSGSSAASPSASSSSALASAAAAAVAVVKVIHPPLPALPRAASRRVADPKISELASAAAASAAAGPSSTTTTIMSSTVTPQPN